LDYQAARSGEEIQCICRLLSPIDANEDGCYHTLEMKRACEELISDPTSTSMRSWNIAVGVSEQAMGKKSQSRLAM